MEILAAQNDLTLMKSRRAFPVSQAAWDKAAIAQVSPGLQVGWHDGGLHPETGAIALVNQAGPHTDLIGELIRVTRTALDGSERSVVVYVYDSAAGDVDVSLTRRAFLAIGLLANEYVVGRVEIVA